MDRRNAFPLPTHLPERWLFSDEGRDLVAIASRLLWGSGIVFRHYGLEAEARDALLAEVREIAAARGLLLAVAGEVPPSGEDLPRHANRHDDRPGPLTAAAHDLKELRRAEALGAALVFLSPVFDTASHPEARALGPIRFGLLARQAKVPVAALGGMNAAQFRRLQPLGARAWGGISAFD